MDLHAVNAMLETNAVVAFTARIDRENASRRVRGVAGRLHKSLESIQQFTTIVDAFVSTNPQIAALILGSFKVVVLVSLVVPLRLSTLTRHRLPDVRVN